VIAALSQIIGLPLTAARRAAEMYPSFETRVSEGMRTDAEEFG
jgi:hypothetical protein